MKTYKNITEQIQHLDEAIKYTDFPKAVKIITKYLTRKIGKTYHYPEPETFTTGGSKKVGIRLFIKPKRSIRINWNRGELNASYDVESLDYWDGLKDPSKPTAHIKFDKKLSLVKILPFIVDFVNNKLSHKEGVYVEEQTSVSGDLLLEGRSVSPSQIKETINNVLEALAEGISFEEQEKNGAASAYGPKWQQVRQAIRKTYKALFTRGGGSQALVISSANVGKIDPKVVLEAVTGSTDTVKFKVTKGKSEKIEVPEADNRDDLDRLTYEQQLESLKSGMKLLMANATNALFLGGRGGTGKTQTVEDMLAAAGKKDGEGYIKVAGSATAAGMYRILFENHDQIVLFDDADSALADQEGRNLIKAATDTKKVRKIAWQKGGKAFVDPDDYDPELDGDKLPRSFEFTGKVIFISNLPVNKLDPDGALRTRGFLIDIDPTNEEIYDFMVKIAPVINLEVDYNLNKNKRLEVVDILRDRKVAEKTANLRSLVRGLNVRAGIEQQGGSTKEWKEFVLRFA